MISNYKDAKHGEKAKEDDNESFTCMKEISCLCGKWKWRPDKFLPPFRICSRTEWQCCFPPGGHSICKWELGERWKTLHFKFCWQFWVLELQNFSPFIVAINPLFAFSQMHAFSSSPSTPCFPYKSWACPRCPCHDRDPSLKTYSRWKKESSSWDPHIYMIHDHWLGYSPIWSPWDVHDPNFNLQLCESWGHCRRST